MIDGMRESVETMRKKGAIFDVTPVCGDICNLDMEPGSFDAIYSMEAIEHVHDLKKMFARCVELLKPGGNLILVNDSNPLHRKTRDETVAMWRDRETSWKWTDQLRHWRPIEHKHARPFAVMREEIVKAANPYLDQSQMRSIVDATAGLLKTEIEQISKNYRAGMTFPVIGKYDWCRNPETGEYAERLLDPFALAEMLLAAGFKPKVRHAFRKFPLNLANSIQFPPMNRLLFNVRATFVVFGKKP
jgi:SAM-dependent methyltransferase